MTDSRVTLDRAAEVLAARAEAVKAMPSLDAYETLVDDLLAALPLALGDELDVERLADAIYSAGVSIQDDETRKWIGYVEATERIASEYRALRDSLTTGDDR